ncbi:MAG TPA: 23S rRNA (adenine(2503)-C(2))-methyltransferase RlmN [Planctomycetota bacterium]|nr:23S rRNA (adenine(2503)-C(2))-methyltransferase RlmN [Planctomycetota bacterium]
MSAGAAPPPEPARDPRDGGPPRDGAPPVDVLGLTLEDFLPLAREHGVRTPRATACYHAAFREGRALEPWVSIRRPPIVARQVEGETVKFVQQLAGGLQTESVLIPMLGRGTDGAAGRQRGLTHTLCVSSQVGCAVGCAFCETAQMGLLGNLHAADIVAQWFAATHELGVRPKNLVFMGMGEPLDNLDAVLAALIVLCGHHGPALGAAHVAVSTSGRVDGMARLGAFVERTGFHKLNLAVSLNAPNDAIRSALMPINARHPMAELREAMAAFPVRAKGAICVEYVLIPGVNDADAHCDELCDYLRGIRCSLNVIPYNPRRDSPWRAPTEAEVTRFMDRAVANRQFVRRRQTKGRSVMGACGQLGNPELRRGAKPVASA